MSGGLGIDQRLQDRVEPGAHQLAVIGGAHRFSQFEQRKLVQGHRVMPTFVSDFGRFSQRLTGWPLTLVTDTATTIRNPIYTTRRDSIPPVAGKSDISVPTRLSEPRGLPCRPQHECDRRACSCLSRASDFEPVSLVEGEVAWIGGFEIGGQVTRVDDLEAGGHQHATEALSL